MYVGSRRLLKCISPAHIEMPAVQLEQLQKEIQALTSSYAQPVEFHRQLIALLERHADLTFRPGQAGKNQLQAVESYHVSPIVLQQIETGLSALISHDPAPALALADELWTDERLEPRTVAAMLIGALPAEQSEQCLERIKAWAQPGTEKPYLTSLFKRGSAGLRRAIPQRWLDTVSQWLSASEPANLRLGILAMLPVIEDRGFENLPAVFKLIGPVLQDYRDANKNELRELLVALSRRSPSETSFFLRQILSLSHNPGLVKLVRACLAEFPEEARTRLRSFLQALPK